MKAEIIEAWEKPSYKQINFAKDLAEQLGEEDNYNWIEMTRDEISELIDTLKDRLGMK